MSIFIDNKFKYGLIAGVMAFATYSFIGDKGNPYTEVKSLYNECESSIANDNFDSCNSFFTAYSNTMNQFNKSTVSVSDVVSLHKSLTSAGYENSIEEMTQGLLTILPSGKYVTQAKVGILDAILGD
ncbi:hypothetical protein L0B53_19015 (plasmid) [Vibrio sp. SS-MA-C1-2]|uniref:hypothetical protein n=1 Tax=Vibrio sp. SS-MA-C1-2 TaxID=2908646 RepID=UPI001F173CEB|nr:hypothetical protein [Vibrio sp. SS-MA-C1-2]UJF20228.1 hypothetical protein L0B53_19015 [Vibrio sp. SS-MA-C1-2]